METDNMLTEAGGGALLYCPLVAKADTAELAAERLEDAHTLELFFPQ